MENIPVLHLDQFLLSKGNGVYVNDLRQHLHDHHNMISLPHKHDFYLNVLFTKGSGIHEIDFNSYSVGPGSFFVLTPGQMHHWKLSDDVQGYVFSHSKEFYLLRDNQFELDRFPFFYSNQNTPEVKLEAETLTYLVKICQSMLEEYHDEKDHKSLRIHALITLVYVALTRAYSPSSNKVEGISRYGSTIKTFEQLVEAQFHYRKSPAEYAELLNVSLKHLNRICNQVLGVSVSNVITGRVLLESKRLLMSKDLSIAEIANELGYTDYSYFSRLFKKHTCQTPHEFRKGYMV
ncbi:AraC family transcriptional regulator [uncultured Roseivirga sp.]|uniref:AraC family transcriptional regulator n=1 Tax=uncultured Roseivirga sp. TaxID=543088 RepID=UPI0030D8254A|tara:strand:+ start:12477 stop:13349 length:873 start_codon:yes stop_codon:yes gene_type:complete